MFHTCKQDSAEKFKNHRELKRKKFIESLSILSFKINKPVDFCAVLKCSVIHSDSMIPWTLQALCPSNSPGKNTGVGLPFPTPEDLPHPETVPTSLAPPAWAGSFFTITLPAAAAKSDSVRPHRRQLTRLLCPWDSPGKNTRVGCHFFLQCPGKP